MTFLFPANAPHKIVIATHNKGKWQEFSALLRPYDVSVVSASDLGLPSPEETGDSFKANALLKAKAAAASTGMLALADDSGLCVNALGGRPGIYSARWAEPSKDFKVAMERIQHELGTHPDRSAYFTCVLALAWPDGRYETIEGRVEGTLAPSPRGGEGHGYDPLFIPFGETRTFAEMEEGEKNKISHRGQATQLLIDRFFAPSLSDDRKT